MLGSAKCSRGTRSSPRSRPTTVSPALVSSRAMMLPVQPMPTMTASTSFNRVVMPASPSRKIRDGLRLDDVALVAVLIDQCRIDRGEPRIAHHAPGGLVAVAPIDRIGEEAFHGDLQQGLEKRLAVEVVEQSFAGFQLLERGLPFCGQQAVEVLLVGLARPGIGRDHACCEKLTRRQRQLVAVFGLGLAKRALPIELRAAAPRARELAVDERHHAALGPRRREVVGGDHGVGDRGEECRFARGQREQRVVARGCCSRCGGFVRLRLGGLRALRQAGGDRRPRPHQKAAPPDLRILAGRRARLLYRHRTLPALARATRFLFGMTLNRFAPRWERRRPRITRARANQAGRVDKGAQAPQQFLSLRRASHVDDRNHPKQACGGVHGDIDHGAVQARLPQHVHPGHPSHQSFRSRDGRARLHHALHPGARGPRPSRRVRGPQPPAAQRHRGVPGGACLRHRQPPQSGRRVRRRNPGDTALEARRRRHRDRWRFPRHAGDRAASIPRLSRCTGSADQSDQASRRRSQRPDRLRRGCGLSGRHPGRRRRRRGDHSGQYRRRGRRRSVRADRVRGFRPGEGAGRPLDLRHLSAGARCARGVQAVACRQGTLKAFIPRAWS